MFIDESDFAVETRSYSPLCPACRRSGASPQNNTRLDRCTQPIGMGGLVNTLYLQLVAPDGTVYNGDVTCHFPKSPTTFSK